MWFFILPVGSSPHFESPAGQLHSSASLASRIWHVTGSTKHILFYFCRSTQAGNSGIFLLLLIHAFSQQSHLVSYFPSICNKICNVKPGSQSPLRSHPQSNFSLRPSLMHPILSTSSLIPDPCVPVPEPLFILFLWPPSLFSPCLRKGQILLGCTSVVSSPCPKLLVSFPFLIPLEVQQISAAVTPTWHGAYLYLCLSFPSTLLPKQI